MKTFALLENGSLKRTRQIDEADTEIIQIAESKGYKEVVYPELANNQVYSTPSLSNNQIVFSVIDMTAQEIYERDYSEWQSQMDSYNQQLPDPVEYLIQYLVNQGVIVAANLPAALKNLYQEKTAHKANEPVQP